ncbi:uncharacterized protein BDW70DRAFT_4758 [Aspergillus foveolatus]|uniref:uncharacterized protein n=1 Tax=Aspergillus foveolatus TaxID=210207 RepID=UPI003CCD7138
MEPSHHLPQDDDVSSSCFSEAIRFYSNNTAMSRLVIPSLSGASVLKYDWYASYAAILQDNLHTDHEVLDFSSVSAEDSRFLASDNHRPLKSANSHTTFQTGS